MASYIIYSYLVLVIWKVLSVKDTVPLQIEKWNIIYSALCVHCRPNRQQSSEWLALTAPVILRLDYAI